MPFVVYNASTESPVSHQAVAEQKLGHPPITLIWESRKDAARHAYNLGHEYAILRPELPVLARTWKVREATGEEIILARAVAAFGNDWADEIGVGQARPEGVKPRDNVHGEGDEIETFRENIGG